MRKRYAYLLLLPSVLILALTVFIPIITTFRYSLKRYSLTDPGSEKYIGLKNYQKILLDPAFHNALLNSFIILVIVVVFGLMLSVAIALVLNRKTKLTPLLTAVAIIPWALPPIVNGIIWKFIFFPGYGLLNKIIIGLGIVDKPIAWTTNRYMFLVVISIVLIWRIVPFSALIILANLQNIPNSYYEAIYMGGSTRIQAFRYITLPLLVPSFGIVLINLTTTALNVFDEIIAISGYQFENQTLLVYNYSTTFNFLDFGLGSAISYTVMLITGIFGYYYVKNMTVEKVY